MDSEKRRILHRILILAVALGVAFVVTNYKAPIAREEQDAIRIERADIPQITYQRGSSSDEVYQAFTPQDKQRLYTDGIVPFISNMQAYGYDVIAIDVVEHLRDFPILMESILYQNKTGTFITYQAAVIEYPDGSYAYSPSAPPGYDQ